MLPARLVQTGTPYTFGEKCRDHTTRHCAARTLLPSSQAIGCPVAAKADIALIFCTPNPTRPRLCPCRRRDASSVPQQSGMSTSRLQVSWAA
jgi:hypothetical protein